MNRTVTLTDEAGTPIGEADLLEAHTNGGQLHRAISVYVFDSSKKKVLIQRRSKEKLLFAGLWANTCCSHPYKGENAKDAGERRLQEEMGFTCDLTEGPSFVYKADDPNGHGTEHEFDIMLTGVYDPLSPVKPDPKEVEEWTWRDVDDLLKDMEKNPDAYALWFRIGLPKLLAHA